MGNTGNVNIHGNPGEVFEHWMARQLDRSLALNAIHGAMIDETKINDYEQKIANNDKIEKAIDKANDKTAQRRKDIGVKQDKKEKQQQLIEFARKAYQAAENKEPDEVEMNKLKGFKKTKQYVDYIKEHGFKLVKDENNKTSLHIDGEKLIEYRNKQKIGDRQQFIPNEKDINNSFFDNDIKKEDVIDTTIVDKNKNKEEIIDVPEV